MAAAKQKIEPVRKPFLTGSWHGKDAHKLALRCLLAGAIMIIVQAIAALMLTFNIGWLRILIMLVIVGLCFYYRFSQGAVQGEADVAIGEIMFRRKETGTPYTKEEHDRCFCKGKGFFAVLVGMLPFVLFGAVYAFVSKPVSYSIGALPSWTSDLLYSTEMGDALHYYTTAAQTNVLTVLRIVDRVMILPYINVAMTYGNAACTLMEKLTPALVLIAPLGYGFGYLQGVQRRIDVNTGIKSGNDRRKRKEQKERKKRQQSRRREPEQLI